MMLFLDIYIFLDFIISQRVCINGITSHSITVHCGEPQGSVLGSVLFVFYTSLLPEIIAAHFISRLDYCDDLFHCCYLQKIQRNAF